MQDMNTIPTVGNFGDVARNANANFRLLKIAIDLLENNIEHSRGYFSSASALSAAYPSPVVGDWAIVEVSGTPTIYKCSTMGTWSNSGTAWAGGSVDLAEYLKKGTGDAFIIAGSNNYPFTDAVFQELNVVAGDYPLPTFPASSPGNGRFNITEAGKYYNVTYYNIQINVESLQGESFFVRANANYYFSWAWLTTAYIEPDRPNQNQAAALVAGTSVGFLQAGQATKITVPTGAIYMYILSTYSISSSSVFRDHRPAEFKLFKSLKKLYEQDFAALPDTVADIKSKTDYMDSWEGFLVGAGTELARSPYIKSLTRGKAYRLHIDNTVPISESASMSSDYVQFRIVSYNAAGTATYVTTFYVGGAALREQYYFTVPQDSDSIRIVARFDTGYIMTYRIEDTADTSINNTGFYYLRGMCFVKSLTTANGKFSTPTSSLTSYFVYYLECTKGQQFRLEMKAEDNGAIVTWGCCPNIPAVGGEFYFANSKTLTNAGDTHTTYFTAPEDGYVFVRKRVITTANTGRSNTYLYAKSAFNQLGFYAHRIQTPTFTTNRGIVVNTGTDKAQGSVFTSLGTASYGITSYIDISAYSYLLLRQTHGSSANLYNKVYSFGSAFYKDDENGNKVFVSVADVCQYAFSGSTRSAYSVVAVPSDAKYIRLFGVVSSYTFFYGLNREFSEDLPLPEIVKFNDPTDMVNKLQQLNRPKGNNQIKQLVMLHFSDIHSNEKGLKRVKDFYDYYQDYIDDVIHTGDINSAFDTYDMEFWNNANVPKFLNVIGNHDCAYASDSGGELHEIPPADCYAKYFAPYVSNWGVTIDAGVCFYYKDYTSAKVRLIVIDEYHFDMNSQDTWLVNTLADARANGLHVLMATHSSIVPSFQGAETAFAQIGSSGPGRMQDITAMQIVQDFIDAGGQLICWICGHAHYDHCGFPTSWPDQFKIIVSTQSPPRAANYNVARIEGTKSEDSFNIISVDTNYKYLRVMKVGADRDRLLRKLDSFYYNYGTRKIYHEQNVPDITGKEDKMGVEEYVDGTTVVTAGKCYVVDASSANVPITLPDVSEAHFMNIIFYVTTGTSTAISISAPTGGTLLYADSYPSTFDASSTYEVNCLWNGTNWILAAMKLKTTL